MCVAEIGDLLLRLSDSLREGRIFVEEMECGHRSFR